MRQRTVAAIARRAFDRFVLLPIGAVIALIWANTAPESYFTFAQRFAFVVNEIGMAFFFALLTQEIVEGVMPGGALHSWRRWTMPIVAGIGSVIGAAAVYVGYVHFQYEDSLASAWPIVCAVDAAATYYVLKTIMPASGALPFALLLAIVADVIGMILVAPRHLILQARAGGAALMLAALGLAALLRSLRVRTFWPFLCVCGSLSWLAFSWEGLHPAFALIPIVPFLRHEPRHVNVFADPPDNDPVHHAEHQWHILVQIVVFFFGLVNAGVILKDYDTGSWAMVAGQLIGRPLGIFIGVQLGLMAGLHLPRHVGWRELLVIAFATSSGFAIALFFATGLLATGPVLAQAKIGVLASAAGIGLAFFAARLLKVGRTAAH